METHTAALCFSLVRGDDGALERYCGVLRDTAEWGGQLELRALAAALHCIIVVYRYERIVLFVCWCFYSCLF